MHEFDYLRFDYIGQSFSVRTQQFSEPLFYVAKVHSFDSLEMLGFSFLFGSESDACLSQQDAASGIYLLPSDTADGAGDDGPQLLVDFVHNRDTLTFQFCAFSAPGDQPLLRENTPATLLSTRLCLATPAQLFNNQVFEQPTHANVNDFSQWIVALQFDAKPVQCEFSLGSHLFTHREIVYDLKVAERRFNTTIRVEPAQFSYLSLPQMQLGNGLAFTQIEVQIYFENDVDLYWRFDEFPSYQHYEHARLLNHTIDNAFTPYKNVTIRFPDPPSQDTVLRIGLIQPFDSPSSEQVTFVITSAQSTAHNQHDEHSSAHSSDDGLGTASIVVIVLASIVVAIIVIGIIVGILRKRKRARSTKQHFALPSIGTSSSSNQNDGNMYNRLMDDDNSE